MKTLVGEKLALTTAKSSLTHYITLIIRAPYSQTEMIDK